MKNLPSGWRLTTHSFTCTTCHGSGSYCPHDEGSQECPFCKNGIETKTYAVSPDKCERCNGGGIYAKEEVIYGNNIFGEKTRKNRTTRYKCSYCLGIGKIVRPFKITRCDNCAGEGKIGRWEKSFFGGDVLRKYDCNQCNGHGEIKSIEMNEFMISHGKDYG